MFQTVVFGSFHNYWYSCFIAPVPICCKHPIQNKLIFTKISEVDKAKDLMYCLCAVSK